MTSTDITQLFLIMQAIYGHKWSVLYTDQRLARLALDEWRRGLHDVSRQGVERALNLCRRGDDDFPPSLPQFRRWCLPSAGELGLESPDEAVLWLRDMRSPRRPNLVRQAMSMIDAHARMNEPAHILKSDFLRAYKKILTEETRDAMVKERDADMLERHQAPQALEQTP